MNWLLHTDLLLGAAGGVLIGFFNRRYNTSSVRVAWAIAGAVLGLLGGAVAYAAAAVAAMFLGFSTPVPPRGLLALHFLALGIVLASVGRLTSERS